MAKGSTFEGMMLNFILCNVQVSTANVTAALGLGSSVPGSLTGLWSALHTADPTAGSGQNQSEVSFVGYARVLTTRSTAGFVVSGSGPATASPVAAITFPQLTSTSTGTATYWSIGSSSSGAGQILYSGSLSPSINLGQNVTPQITTGSSITES